MAQAHHDDPNAIFRSMAESLGHGLVLLDQTGRILWGNAAVAGMSGLDAPALADQDFTGLFQAADQQRIREALERALISGSRQQCHGRIGAGNGSSRSAVMDVFLPGAEHGVFAVMLRDVSGEIQLASAVHALAETPPRCPMHELVAIAGLATGMRLVALARRDTIERDQFVVVEATTNGRRAGALSEADRRVVEEALASEIRQSPDGGGPVSLRMHGKSSGGMAITIPLHGPGGRLTGVLVCVNDALPGNMRDTSQILLLFGQRMAAEIEADELEQRLLQSRDSETLRHLAKGIAHEFNNILMKVSGNFQLLQRKVPKELGADRYIESGLAAVNHGASIVKEVEQYAADRTLDLAPMPLGPVLRRCAKLWAKSLPEDVSLDVEIETDCLVMGNQAAMLELIGQLVRNAIDAVADAKFRRSVSEPTDHRITIELTHIPNGSQNRVACVSVTDTGIGMSQQEAARVFDPFFTTKEPGQGTGLGLAMAQAIAIRHQGRIEVASAPGRGARFELRLPLVEVAAAAKEE